MALNLVYDQAFLSAGTESKWQTYLSNDAGGASVDIVSPTRVTDDGDPYIKVSITDPKPLFWDGNHYLPGAGYVNLLAVAYNGPGNEFPTYNIADGKAIITMRVKDFKLPKQARLIWWFQNSPDGLMFYNYGQIENTIDEQLGFGGKGWMKRSMVDGIRDSGWIDVEIPFPARDSAWTCYGSNPLRTGVGDDSNVIYGCARGGVASAMTHPVLDMGIHALWQNTASGSIPPVQQIKGELHIRRVQIFENHV